MEDTENIDLDNNNIKKLPTNWKKNFIEPLFSI